MSQGSFNPKIRFLGQKMCSVARLKTDKHTHRHAKVGTVGTLSRFQELVLQPIIKDRPNNMSTHQRQSCMIVFIPYRK